MKLLKESLAVWLVLTIATGLIYPLAMTGIGQILFHHQANGSIIEQSGKIVGSELIGQEFTNPGHFWSRRSTTGPMPYNGASSTGSNQGPLNPALLDAVKGRVDALRATVTTQLALVPIDLATASGSGLDPHITPAAAAFQIERVAAARAMTQDELKALVAKHTEGRQFGIFGEPKVNVLMLNLDLDKSHPILKSGSSNGG
jgi:potassium-transporting ATPase KdpC subunit